MLNYPVDRSLLESRVPKGTMLDTYKGVAYVSVVGFLFLRARILGVPVPWHQDFEEVNLRFYVRRFAGDDWRRGVVFIREIVPKAAIAAVARAVYNERYTARPMRHALTWREDGVTPASVEYGWRLGWRERGRNVSGPAAAERAGDLRSVSPLLSAADGWQHVRASATQPPRESNPGSLEEFITEHYWGYVPQRDGSTVEYEVEHPRWQVMPAVSTELCCDVAAWYGEPFVAALSLPPSSAFIANGSRVTVYRGVRLPG